LWLDEAETAETGSVPFFMNKSRLEWAEGRKGLTASETNRQTPILYMQQ